MDEYIIEHRFLSVKVEFKREPMSWQRFEMICWLIGIYIVGSGIIKFFALSV